MISSCLLGKFFNSLIMVAMAAVVVIVAVVISG
jgi:hypothetical protein